MREGRDTVLLVVIICALLGLIGFTSVAFVLTGRSVTVAIAKASEERRAILDAIVQMVVECKEDRNECSNR